MPRAARLGDSIGHTPPGDGPQGGGKDVTGKIICPCSGNVFTNGIKAARAFVDMTVCSLHPQAPLPIATGSSTVFINGLPAARVSDKIVCRAYITDGSANVFIGGAAVQTNSFLPEGIFEEVVELVENGATLVLGAGEIVVGGFYNSAVRIGAGLASIPYMLDSVDAAVGVQKEIAESLNYNFKSDGAKQIGEALKPVGAFVQEKITVAKDFSEEHIGLGATAIVFGSAEAVVEIAGVVTGRKGLKSFIDVPLPWANSTAEIIGAASGPGRVNLINTTGRFDNCTACVTANISNKLQRRTIDNLITAQQVEAKWGSTGAHMGFSQARSLAYVERATATVGVKTPMLALNAPIGHYSVFGTVIKTGQGHIMYGQVLPNGRVYFYDPQIGGGKMTYEYMKTVYKDMRTYHMEPE